MHMQDRAWIATRKGLFEMRRRSAGWAVERASFLGEPVSMLMPPGASGRMIAALNLGHFGVKLHASDDAGASWHELAAPAYPAQPADATGPAWKLAQVWSLEERGGTIWAGRFPAACSARPIAASRGNWSTPSGSAPSAPSGSAAATTRRASTRSARIRPMPASC